MEKVEEVTPSSLMKKAFMESKAGVCIKDLDSRVIAQNDACVRFCGTQTGKICDKNCIKTLNKKVVPLEALESLSEGTWHYRYEEYEGENFDVFFLNDGKHLTTIFYPLAERLAKEMDSLTQYGLTNREKEIMELVCRHKTNKEIASALFISEQTLKTHINNIYKKLPVPRRPER